MENFAKKQLILFIVILLSGCSLTTNRRQINKKPIENPEVSIENQLSQENTELKRENLFLQTKIEEIIQHQEQNRKFLEDKINNLSKTINLLEKNIQAQNTKKSDPLPAKKKKRQLQPSKNTKAQIDSHKVDIKKQGSITQSSSKVVDIQTPSSSSAIEIVSLVPEAGLKKTTQINTKKSAIKKPPKRAKPIVLMNPKENKPKKNIELEDPDIQNPVSPIRLIVVPGAKRMYRKAFKTYSGKKYLVSIKQFSEFLEKFPNDQDADNSQFWIGQAQFIVSNYLEAEHSFRKILKVYQHGNTRNGYKTPDAILMLGRIYLIRKNPNRAEYYFRKVIKMFPDSRSSVKAKNEIQSLNSFME